MPIPRAIEDHYGVEPDEYWHKEYFVADETYFAQQIKTFNSLFRGSETRRRALDIGAGTGKCLVALGKAGFDAFGIEGSEPFYRAALERNGISPDHISRASVEDARFEPGRFEFVTFGAVLEHLYDPSAAIGKALEWIAPDGLIHIEVPSARWLIARLGNLFYRLSGTDYVVNLSPMHSPYHLYEFELNSFRRHGARFGYEIADHRFYVAQTFMPRIISPLVARFMEATKTGMQLEVWLRRI
ncbi:MAG: class I SAM-dependent methyltransferase [Acidobacteriota bacterium]